ncbi:MAG: ABC transporter ATP-binding protein [Thermoguttaceae bacterium]
MSDRALEVNHVSKKFRKGEIYDSLRDWVPALIGRLFRKPKSDALSKREFWALKDVSLSVKRGEVLGIIGHNGAGKSTMLKLLSGVLKPTQGTIRVNGSLSALIEVGAGFHPDLTGRQNIYLNGAILGMKRAEITKRFDQIVAFSGLEEFLDTPVKRYSTGMYARLGFSVAAHVNSDILIVDEVLSVGDWVFQNKCMERMKEVLKSGVAVVFVSHNLLAVTSLCTRVILLDHGRAIREGDPQEVVGAYLNDVRRDPDDLSEQDASVSDLVIRDEQGPRIRFEAGDNAWIDVEVAANRRLERLALVIFLTNEEDYVVFVTSTGRLGYPAFTLEASETAKYSFRLKLHLAPGVFHVGAAVFRYDADQRYDECRRLATLFIAGDNGVGGMANLYPEVENCEPCAKSCETAAQRSSLAAPIQCT